MKVFQEQRETKGSEALAPPQLESGEFALLDLAVLLAKGKKPMASIAAGTALVGLTIALLLPTRYTGTTTIMPPQQSQSMGTMLLAQLAGSGLGSLASLAGTNLGLKNPNDMYIGMLNSRTIEDAIIAKFELQNVYKTDLLSKTRDRLESATNITSGKDSLIEISFEDKDRQRAADVANAYVDELRNLTQNIAVTEASQRRLFFEQQLKQAKDDLAAAEVALKDTQQKTGMIQLSSQARATIEAIGRLRAKIAATEVELQAMGSFATEQNPDYILVKQQLAGLRVQLNKFEQGESDAGDPLVASGKIPAVGLEYVRRFREVKYREAIFELMAKQYEVARLDEAKEAAIIQVVDQAVVPDRKSSPHRAVIVLVSLFLGMLFGAIWVIGSATWSQMRQNRRTSEQLTQLKTLLRLR